MALGDQAGKAAVDELVAQFPELKAFIAEQLALVRSTVQQIVADAKDEINTVVGGSLAAITAERTEAVKQIADEVHGILDRIQILPRKETPTS